MSLCLIATVYSTKAAAGSDPMLAQVSESVARFLPTYRRDMKAGMTWADTVSGKVIQQGLEVDRTIVANYKTHRCSATSGSHLAR